MRLVVQRVRSASVTIGDRVAGEIGPGLLILVGVAVDDTAAEAEHLAGKAARLRIFRDGEGKMNRSVQDIGGACLVISQFTLHGDCAKGNRPSYIEAARPETAVPLYERFVEALRGTGVPVETGEFGADMLVRLENDGPVTLMLERSRPAQFRGTGTR